MRVTSKHRDIRTRRVACTMLAIAAIVVLAISSVAFAAPRPSGTVAAQPAAEVQTPSVDGLVFTRSDIPRPSGDAALWLDLEGFEAPQPQTGPTKLPTIQAPSSEGIGSQNDVGTEDAWWTADMDCTACHAAADLVAATAASTVLTDENGTVVNPHDIPAVADHAALVCANCHRSHELGEGIAKTAQRACISCHHAYVYDCYTCHA